MRLATKLLLVFVGLLAVAAIAVAVVARDSTRRAERLDRVWREELFGGRAPGERFPPRQPNATALALERLAAELGIDVATPHHPVPPPEPDDAERWERLREPMREHLQAVVSSAQAGEPAPGPELAAFVEQRREVLAEIRELLVVADPPVWELDIELGAEAPLPNLIAQLEVHRLLLVSALAARRQGDDVGAERFLEAAWRLGEAAADHPFTIVQAIRFLEIRNALATLRQLCAPGGHWDDRLAALTPRADFLRTLRFEGWAAHHTFRTGIPIEDSETGVEQSYSLHPVFWVDLGETLEHAVERLRSQDPTTFDGQAFYEEMADRIPFWGMMARLMLPHTLAFWTKAARTELVIEHTRQILAARARLARGEPPRTGRAPSAAVPSLSWVFEADPGGFRIHLDGDLVAGEEAPVALDFRLAREVCGPASD